VVLQLCGLGSVAVPADAAASAGSHVAAALPAHLGPQAVEASRPALWAALDAGPPRWRAAAVLLRGTGAAGEATLPVLRQLAAAGDDPVVAMWTGQFCLRSEACTQADRQRWLDLEPDNLAPWLDVLASAPAGAAREALLPRMAMAQRFDLHFHALLDAVLQGMPSAVMPYLQQQLWIEAIGIEAATALPSLQALGAACAEPLDRGSPRRAACGAIARTMVEHSDTLLGAGMGLRLAERTYMPQAEAKALRAALTTGMAPSPVLFEGPQPLSCASVDRVRTWMQQLASQGEMASLRAASTPR
jgi:hypothetical protein